MDKGQWIIGEFHPAKERREETRLNCFFPHRVQLQMVLQDQLGRPHLERRMELDRGSHSLTFDLSRLKSGQYHMWISFGEQTVIRTLQVEKSEKGFSLFRLFRKAAI